MTKIKRKQYLVHKPFQLRYMALVVIPLIILLAALHYLIYYAVFNEMLVPEAIVKTLLPAMRRVNITLAVSLPIIFYLILRLALIYSNRIIGPLPRLEKELDRMIEGDYSLRLKTRQNDELKFFVNKINTLLEKMDRGRTAQGLE